MALPPFDPASEPLGSSNPLVRDLNSKNLDIALQKEDGTWFDRFGLERPTLAAAIDPAGLVQTAVNAKSAAEGARDAAFVNAEVYDSVSAGLAAVGNDQQFQVVSGDEIVRYRRVDAATAVPVARYPSVSGVETSVGVAVDLSSDPGQMAGEFHSSDDEFTPLMADESGISLFALDANGFPIASLGGEFHGSNDDDWDFAALNELMQVIYSAADGVAINPWVAEFYNDDGPGTYALVDQSGNQLLSWGEDGELLTNANTSTDSPPLIPYQVENSIYGMGAKAQLLADATDVGVLTLAPGNDRHVRVVVDTPMIDNQRTVAAGGGWLIPDDSNVLHIIVGIGQSLAVGAQSAPTLVSIAPLFPADALMFDATLNSDVRMGLETQGAQQVLNADTLVGFIPLVAKVGQGSGSRGETIMESSANELSRQAREIGAAFRSLSFTAAQGGTNYDGLKKGSQVYANMLVAVEKSVELAAGRGWLVVVDACYLKHGEADSGNDNYFNDLLEWQSDINADFKAITNQQADVPFIMAQHSSFFSTSQSAIAMYKAHNESPVHHLSGPDYPFSAEYFTDLLHFTGPGYFHIGEQVARAQKQALWSSKKASQIVQILDAEVTGAAVSVSVSVPTPPLVIDTSIVPAQTASGFNFYDSSGEIVINDVEIIDDGTGSGTATVELILAAAPSGIDERIDYALVGHNGTRDESTVPRGNLRDSALDLSAFDSKPLYNWGVHQRFLIG